jgi:hypothetical protein
MCTDISLLIFCLKKKSRWDTHQHRLVDHPAVGHEKEIFPGQDYSNPRVKDFMNGK